MNKLSLLLAFLFGSACVVGAQSAGETNPAPTAWQTSMTAELGQDYDGALKDMATYQSAGGSPFLANLRTAWLYYLKKDYDNAAKNYDAAEKLKPGSLNPLLGLLNVRQAQADPTQVEIAAAAVLHVDPLNYRALMVVAYEYYYAHQYDKSLTAYQRVLAVYPDDVSALSGEAWSLYYLGKLDAAIADFNMLLSLNSSDTYSKQGLDLCKKKPD